MISFKNGRSIVFVFKKTKEVYDSKYRNSRLNEIFDVVPVRKFACALGLNGTQEERIKKIIQCFPNCFLKIRLRNE